jgi:glutamyl-tRNA reductase
LTSIEAAMPELPDLNSPEFAAIKTRLARAYIEHKADIGAPRDTDEAVVERVDEITVLLMSAMARAMAERREPWLNHYSWFVDLLNEMLNDLPDKPLDG